MADPRRKMCGAIQVNRKVPDFGCKFNAGHGGPHIDPRTEIAWREGEVPRGMRRKKKGS